MPRAPSTWCRVLAVLAAVLLAPAAAEAAPPSCSIPGDFSITVEAGQSLALPTPPCSDPDGDALQLELTRQPVHGTISPSGTMPLDAARTYTAGSPGSDAIGFRALAGGEASPEYVVPITVKPAVLVVVIPNVVFSYDVANGRRGSIFRTLALKGVLPGSTVRVRCRGAGCPRARQTIRGARGRVPLPAFTRHRLAPGTRLEAAVTTPGQVGVVKIMTIRRSRRPSIATLCTMPGETRRRSCSYRP